MILATKQVINAVARIDEDVQAYEGAGKATSLSEDEQENLHALKSKCNATLSNLTTAARNHATSHGLSPVSLLDAAASHLSATIIELVRLLHLRRAGVDFGTPIAKQTTAAKQSSQQLPTVLPQRSKSYTPQRLNSFKQQDPISSVSSNGNDRVSPSSSLRSRTNTQERSFSNSSETYGDVYSPQSGQNGLPSQKMVNSNSATSVVSSNLHVDPRRNGMTNRSDYRGFPELSQELDEGNDETHYGDDHEDLDQYGGGDDSQPLEQKEQTPEDWTELKVRLR